MVGPLGSPLVLTLIQSCACLDRFSSGERYQELGFTTGGSAPSPHGLSWGHGCSLPDRAASPAWRSSELLANDAEIFVAGVGWTRAVRISHWHRELQTKPEGGSQPPAALLTQMLTLHRCRLLPSPGGAGLCASRSPAGAGAEPGETALCGAGLRRHCTSRAGRIWW